MATNGPVLLLCEFPPYLHVTSDLHGEIVLTFRARVDATKKLGANWRKSIVFVSPSLSSRQKRRHTDLAIARHCCVCVCILLSVVIGLGWAIQPDYHCAPASICSGAVGAAGPRLFVPTGVRRSGRRGTALLRDSRIFVPAIPIQIFAGQHTSRSP